MAGDTHVLAHYLAPLRRRLDEEGVTELVVNRPGEYAVERAGAWIWHEARELTEAALRPLAIAAAAFTRQDVTSQSPICSTVLPSGERCQIILPPAVEHISLTLRKPSAKALSLAEMVQAGLFETVARAGEAADPARRALLACQSAGDWPGFFAAAVAARKNILISGATGSGKTTLAKALVQMIPADERLITIEDARELTLPHRNAVHLVYAKDGAGLARVGPKELLEAALRMRPDRILLQELRDGSAFFYLRNVNSGHPGSITTIHANSAALAFEQLMLLIRESQAGAGMTRKDIAGLLRSSVDIVVQMKRQQGRFFVSEIAYEPAGPSLLAG